MEPIKLDFSQLEIATPLLKGGARFDEGKEVQSFTETLEKAMDNLKDTHSQSAQLMQDYASGKENVDITEVMLAMEKTSMTTELAMQVRNKLVESYQEIVKMQI
jgi:flagellar hook-basal body complex protein FliE